MKCNTRHNHTHPGRTNTQNGHTQHAPTTHSNSNINDNNKSTYKIGFSAKRMPCTGSSRP
eukprot:11988507-Alexandrium_andersonii.AAC.1